MTIFFKGVTLFGNLKGASFVHLNLAASDPNSRLQHRSSTINVRRRNCSTMPRFSSSGTAAVSGAAATDGEEPTAFLPRRSTRSSLSTRADMEDYPTLDGLKERPRRALVRGFGSFGVSI